jgi:hypothetical protein
MLTKLLILDSSERTAHARELEVRHCWVSAIRSSALEICHRDLSQQEPHGRVPMGCTSPCLLQSFTFQKLVLQSCSQRCCSAAAGEEPVAQRGRALRRAAAVLWHEGGELLHGAVWRVARHRRALPGTWFQAFRVKIQSHRRQGLCELWGCWQSLNGPVWACASGVYRLAAAASSCLVWSHLCSMWIGALGCDTQDVHMVLCWLQGVWSRALGLPIERYGCSSLPDILVVQSRADA